MYVRYHNNSLHPPLISSPVPCLKLSRCFFRSPFEQFSCERNDSSKNPVTLKFIIVKFIKKNAFFYHFHLDIFHWAYQNDKEGHLVNADSVHLDKIGMVQLFHYVHLFHEVLQIDFPWDINTNQLYNKNC